MFWNIGFLHHFNFVLKLKNIKNNCKLYTIVRKKGFTLFHKNYTVCPMGSIVWLHAGQHGPAGQRKWPHKLPKKETRWWPKYFNEVPNIQLCPNCTEFSPCSLWLLVDRPTGPHLFIFLDFHTLYWKVGQNVKYILKPEKWSCAFKYFRGYGQLALLQQACWF